MTWEKFKAYSTREKVNYIWDYFRWHILIAFVILCMCISWIYGIATHRDPLLRVQMINSLGENSGCITFKQFLDEHGYDYYDEAVQVNTNIQMNGESPVTNASAMQLLLCSIAAKDADIYFWDAPKLYALMDDGVMADLRQILSEEQLETYEDNLIYSHNPDTGEMYPCAVWLQENSWIRDNQYYGSCAVGIADNTDNIEMAGQFLIYLLNGK